MINRPDRPSDPPEGEELNVLVVLGHPRTDSFGAALAKAYCEGAREAGAEVQELAVADLEFDPDVHADSPENQEMESDLIDAQRRLRWADHLAFVYPNWWGTMPAQLKGFLDRVLTPGFAFSFEGEGPGHDSLLSGRTAELISTMDMPPWVYRFIYRQPGNDAMKRATLGFVGVRTTRVTNLGPVRESDPSDRTEWLAEATRLGESLENGPEPRSVRARRRLKSWLSALRLQFYPMSLLAYALGALAAAGTDAFSALAIWLGFVFVFFLEATTVLTNEYADYETDTENAYAGPFTGGSRVLVEGDLGFGEVRRGALLTGSLAAVAGVGALAVGAGSTLATATAMAVLAALALGYTLPPLSLSYRTLGELDVAVTHSIGVLLVGFLLAGGASSDPLPWLLGLPFLLSVLPSITLAGVPDRDADRTAGKRTIAVRFGIDGAVVVAAGTALAAAAAGILWISRGVPGYDPLVALSIPHGLAIAWAVRGLYRRPEPRRIDRLMVLALSYLIWFAVVPLYSLL